MSFDESKMFSQLSSPTVKVIVGDSERKVGDKLQDRTFYAHRDILTSNSPFFAKAFSNYKTDPSTTQTSWVEAETGVIKLPEDRPDVFANYLAIAYGRTAPSFKAPDSANPENDAYTSDLKSHIREYQTSICRLYVFAEKVQNIAAKRLLLAAMVDSIMHTNINGAFYLPMHEQVKLIYNGTQSSDPMRKFCTNCHVSYGPQGWPKASLYHPEFVDDVMAGIWRHRPYLPSDILKEATDASHYLQEL